MNNTPERKEMQKVKPDIDYIILCSDYDDSITTEMIGDIGDELLYACSKKVSDKEVDNEIVKLASWGLLFGKKKYSLSDVMRLHNLISDIGYCGYYSICKMEMYIFKGKKILYAEVDAESG